MKTKKAIIIFSIIMIICISFLVAFIFLGKEKSPQQGIQEKAGPQIKYEEHDYKIHLSNEQIQRLGIQMEPLKLGSTRAIISRPATVSFDLDRVARLGPRLRAKVVKVIKDMGETVEAGETVAIMSSIELGHSKARYLSAQTRLETELATYNREKTLYTKRITSEASMLEAQARYFEAKAELISSKEALRLYGLPRKEIEAIQSGGNQPLSHFPLKSPIKGVIQRRQISPGDTVGPDETPISVVDTSQVWVFVNAFEHDIPLLQKGQEIQLTVGSLPDNIFNGNLDWISRELKKETRTVEVRAIIKNPANLLRAGMFGTALIHTGKGPKTSIIPVDAIQTIEEQNVVFVPGDEDGSFRPVPVKLGQEADGWVEIFSELKPGDPVVISGAFNLKAAITAGKRSAAHGH